jgi:calcineurin-like phosphoesterase family protein
MLKAWKDTVGARDVVLHLGDLVWTKGGWPHDRLKHLPGKKFLLRGNHDKPSRIAGVGFEVLDGPLKATINGQQILFSHRPTPPDKEGEWDLNIHGHIHNNYYPSWMLDVASDNPKKWLNVSVELMNYTPRTLGWLLERYPSLNWGEGGHPKIQGIWPREVDPERNQR